MQPLLKTQTALPAPRPPPEQTDEIGDLRFRTLVGKQQWQILPPAVQKRFSKRLNNGATAVYTGVVTQTRISRIGRWLTQLTRIIGSPLPRQLSTGTTAAVAVSEDKASSGQFWSRIYGRDSGFPQVIHSIKRFAGPTGLEEYVGCGIGMALRVECSSDGIRFISDHYFLQLGKWRMRLPRWLSPGQVVVSHIDRQHGQFAFVLQLTHPWAGELIYQEILFHDLIHAKPQTRH